MGVSVSDGQEQFRPYQRAEGLRGKRDPRTHAYRRWFRSRHRTPEQQARFERLSGLRPYAVRTPKPTTPARRETAGGIKRAMATVIAVIVAFFNGTTE